MKLLIFAAIIAVVAAEAHWDEDGQYRIVEDGKVPVKVEVVEHPPVKVEVVEHAPVHVKVADGPVIHYPFKIEVDPVYPGLYPYPLLAKNYFEYPIVAKIESPFKYSYKQISNE